jgi:hypothetical protein
MAHHAVDFGDYPALYKNGAHKKARILRISR